jgi:hypothetical protein
MTHKKQYTQPIDLPQFYDLLRKFYVKQEEDYYETSYFRIRKSRKWEGAFVLYVCHHEEWSSSVVHQIARFEVNDERLLTYFTYLEGFRNDVHEINYEVDELEGNFPELRRQRRLAHLLRADRA